MPYTAKNERTYHLRGLSSDKKPILDTLSNGSILMEMDTGKVFIYDGFHKK